MQSLDKETNIRFLPLECADQLVEITPLIMRRIRGEMRRRTWPGLTVPQFRTLNYLRLHPRSSLSDVADHLGLTLPTVSKLVQNLVEQKVISRRSASDRRRICLSLTSQGIAAFATARSETQQQLAESLSSLSQVELSAISDALRMLNKAFSGGSVIVDLR
jgi:DNA-binding MarR family transcriptional regulator